MFSRVPGTSVGPEAEAEGDGVGDFSSEYTVAQEGPEAGPHGEAPAERGVSARAGGGRGDLPGPGHGDTGVCEALLPITPGKAARPCSVQPRSAGSLLVAP